MFRFSSHAFLPAHLAVFFVVTLLACGQDPTLVTPATFERPGDVALVCFDTETGSFVMKGLCGDPDSDRYSLTALVTQTASGVVGAVDLRLGLTLDSDFRVPGYTFVRVGEVPSAILVPEERPSLTYIANYGSRSIQWMDTASFRPDATAQSGVDPGEIFLPDGPTAMAISGDARTLFVTLPELGAVLPIEILASGALAEPDMTQLVMLPADDPGAVGLGTATEYKRFCGVSDLSPVVAEASDVVALGATARPESLLIVDGVLLISDSARPMIHRYTIAEGGGLTALAPIATGVPTTELVVTPFVPETIDAQTADARFIYAIDATDQSVLAIDYAESSSEFLSLVPVSAGENPMRIRLSADARSLAVLTPEYRSFPGQECAGDFVSPRMLRGVFLAVGQTNGAMVFVDVYDLDAACRGGRACEELANGRRVAIERHRPRIGGTVRETLELAGNPSLSLDGSSGILDSTGQTSAEGAPRLASLGTCPAGMQSVWGDQLICVLGDPWAARNERWVATYDGLRPNAVGGAGVFAGGGVFEAELDFCDRGVLGEMNVAGLTEVDPEFGYMGDQLVIVSEPTSAMVAARPECGAFVDPADGQDYDPPAFRILQSNERSLMLEGDSALLAGCLGDRPIEYEVRVRNAYIVGGTSTLVPNRVAADGAGACVVNTTDFPVDPAIPRSYRSDFAQLGRPFVSSRVSFSIVADSPLVGRDSELNFAVEGVPAAVAVDVGARSGPRRASLVENITYSAEYNRLYALDSNSDGFIEYVLGPFEANRIFD